MLSQLTANKTAVKPGERVSKYELLLSTLTGQYVRFVKWADSYAAIVCDRNTLAELPDYVHPSQLYRA
jgi:hypothetical protein